MSELLEDLDQKRQYNNNEAETDRQMSVVVTPKETVSGPEADMGWIGMVVGIVIVVVVVIVIVIFVLKLRKQRTDMWGDEDDEEGDDFEDDEEDDDFF